ncbi:hypothetical protein BDN70DRAFT_892614 [Pholiota conissans]|uniref:Uncharacterized protein n=1 Tax=Pholiota conissans TaxID=109636 RepID=A0A9P5Z858_9AGAR|nr:hypothetical protein BDN70DRAFT_892614 [Pholiota conissans]
MHLMDVIVTNEETKGKPNEVCLASLSHACTPASRRHDALPPSYWLAIQEKRLSGLTMLIDHFSLTLDENSHSEREFLKFRAGYPALYTPPSPALYGGDWLLLILMASNVLEGSNLIGVGQHVPESPGGLQMCIPISQDWPIEVPHRFKAT